MVELHAVTSIIAGYTHYKIKMSSFFRDSKTACTKIGLEPKADWARVEEEFPLLTNDYYLSLIDPKLGESDPIFRQSMPDVAELADIDSSFDPLAEAEQMLSPRMIRRFKDRVVVLVTNKCGMHCRFCFRKRLWKRGGGLADISDIELDEMVATLKLHPEISEVLLSGGDPAMLSTERLRAVIQRFSELEQITVIRLGSRLPVVLPQRFDDEMIDMLGEFDKLWLLTHFNHPNEVTEESSRVCRSLIKRGIPVFNQCVLLRGINDSELVQEELCRKLLAIKVKPHYLFHVDPVRGVRHFSTGVEQGLDILRYLRGRLSSLGTPVFALDLPEGGGKVALQPDYSEGGAYWDINNKKLIKYPDKELLK